MLVELEVMIVFRVDWRTMKGEEATFVPNEYLMWPTLEAVEKGGVGFHKVSSQWIRLWAHSMHALP